ncbi:MAG: OPT family oligopeptide transporter [Candidatus Binataceae bacterium]
MQRVKTEVSAEIKAEPIREITPRAIALGILLALVLGAANAYLGLYAGMTVSASIPAAVISMAALRILGGATILENNVVQTIASAGEAVAAGAIFTFPALVILGRGAELSWRNVTLLCLAGGVMGGLMIVMLRRAYIVEERLPFPEGVACAEVLRAGEGEDRAAAILAGGIISAALKAAQDVGGIVPQAFIGARWVGSIAFSGAVNISAALLGVGYIVGIRIAVLVFLGGVVAWLIAIPLASPFHPELRALPAHVAAARLWSAEARYLGVGAMLVGGLATVTRLRERILRAVMESVRIIRAGRAHALAREETDLPIPSVAAAIALCVPVVFALAWHFSGILWIAAVLAIILVILAFFASAVAGYLTGIVGSSNNPVSGVTVIVLLGVALLLMGFGVGMRAGPELAIMTGAVVCTAAAMAGDSLHDLATGYHVGASPRSLEIAVLIGAIASSFVMAPIINMLIHGYGIAGTPTARAGALAAPQAFLMAKVTQGVFSGNLPWTTIGAGAAFALALEIADRFLERGGSTWRTPVMPIAIGLYLPFGLAATILIGSLPHLLRGSGDRAEGKGLLFAAGLIAGEALMGLASGALVTVGVHLPLW